MHPGERVMAKKVQGYIKLQVPGGFCEPLATDRPGAWASRA